MLEAHAFPCHGDTESVPIDGVISDGIVIGSIPFAAVVNNPEREKAFVTLMADCMADLMNDGQIDLHKGLH
jgi:hypothetical protein